MLHVSILAFLLLAPPSPPELIQAYVDSTRPFEHSAFRIRFREIHEGATKFNGTVVRDGTYVIRRADGRWKIDFKGTNRILNQGRVEAMPEEYEVAVNEKKSYTYVNKDGPEKAVNFVIANLRGLPEDKGVGTTDYFTILLGFVGGNGAKSFVDVLRQSTVEAHQDDTLGVVTWRLDSTGPYGRATIWFDPAHALQVRRLSLVKSGNDLLNDSKVSDRPAGEGNDYSPPGRPVTFVTLLDVSKFNAWGDLYYPATASVNVTTTFDSGQHVTIRYEMQIDNFDHGVEFPTNTFAISSPIPNGFPVQVEDDSNVTFEWRDGRITKIVNPQTERNLASSIFESTFSGVGYFLFFAVSLIFVLILGAWTFRRWSADR